VDLKGIPYVGMDWIQLAQDRMQWRALMKTDEPSNSIGGFEFPD